MASSLTTTDTASNYGWSRINDELLRIVMVGKTGCGKSATGNTILGRKFFESKLSATSLTVDCSKGRAVVDGQKVAVIDTPGLFGNMIDKDEIDQHLSQCISFAAPGPHVFLVVISLVGRYTEEEKQTVQNIQEIFGEAADKYSMVLFTHGDQLKNTTIKEFLDDCPDLQELLARCNHQYHVFNNELEERSQVIELLQKIREICRKNTGSHYTNEIFQQAERAVKGKKQPILRENEEQRRREIEELEGKYEERLREEIKKLDEKYKFETVRLWRERENERKVECLQVKSDTLRERKEREDIREVKQRLQESHEKEARMKAEESNQFRFFRTASKRIRRAFKKR